MANKFGQFDNQIPGGSDIWDNGLAGDILLADYFSPQVEPPVLTAIYRGSKLRAQVYFGVRSDTQLYRGVGQLFP